MMALLPLILISAALRNDENVIFSFKSNADLGDWYILNDDVMGGVSTAKIEINDKGFGHFAGTVSTANNGGFASVRYSSTIQESEM